MQTASFNPSVDQDKVTYSFVARQPILDQERNIFSFELLYRDGEKNAFPVNVSSGQATRKLLAEHLLGYKSKVLGEFKGFVNFDYDCLIEGVPLDFPSEDIVVEVLETCPPSDELLAALTELKQAGYTIALDDHLESAEWHRFYPLVDIIKVDIQQTSLLKARALMDKLEEYQIAFLAEKVETNQEFQRAKDFGFELFQGYFFTKPEIIKNRKINTSFDDLVRLTQCLSGPKVNFDQVSIIVSRNPVLSHQLLSFVNASSSLNTTIKSLKQAVAYLGEDKLKKFASYAVISSFAPGKPSALYLLSLHRARMFQLIMSYLNHPQLAQSAYLVGLLSLIDAILDVEINTALGELTLDDEIKRALLEGEGVLGTLLSLSQSIEASQWDEIDQIRSELGVSEQVVIACNVEAAVWLAELPIDL